MSNVHSPHSDDLLSTTEAAEILGCSGSSVRRFIDMDALKASLIGGRWLISRKNLTAFSEQYAADGDDGDDGDHASNATSATTETSTPTTTATGEPSAPAHRRLPLRRASRGARPGSMQGARRPRGRPAGQGIAPTAAACFDDNPLDCSRARDVGSIARPPLP